MTTPLPPPKRKDPVKRTRLPTRPPFGRSRDALGLTAVAAEGRFQLQVCGACRAVQYPPRQLCGQCLSDSLAWSEQPDGGTLLAETVLHHSNDLYFRERLPWRLGLVTLDCGPTVVAHVMQDCLRDGRVQVALKLDRSGQAVVLATPSDETPNQEDDRVLRETTCDPKHRRVLVTDGRSTVGQAVARSLLDAGARTVFVGDPEPWKSSTAFEALRRLPAVTVFNLDVTDGRSVHDLASQISAKVDILVNTSSYLRSGGVTDRKDVNTPRSEMDVNYFGLLRLATEFGPVMRSRGADGDFGACAWVNVLSIYALAAHPAFATWSASLAAALSLSHGLRRELGAGGVKVINLFPGPVEDEWHQLLPPPKVTPRALARALVDALAAGVEDVYPGAVAQELRARLDENPKEVERQLDL